MGQRFHFGNVEIAAGHAGARNFDEGSRCIDTGDLVDLLRERLNGKARAASNVEQGGGFCQFRTAQHVLIKRQKRRFLHFGVVSGADAPQFSLHTGRTGGRRRGNGLGHDCLQAVAIRSANPVCDRRAFQRRRKIRS